jgi:2-polyprenyl-6-methoxyphenol hydroxylase-like FAD-dependent oxidoreductase
MPNPSVLISGAGIAGPALAVCLARAGFGDVTVVESAPALRPGGYAVDFRGDAQLAVVERIGLRRELEAVQTHMGAVAYVDERDRELARMPSDIFSGDLEILRGDLSQVLFDAGREQCDYRFADSVTALAEHDGGVDVRFASGEERTYDLVVGADGLHSTVRGLRFGPEAEYRRELGYFAAVYTTPNHLGLDRAGRFHSVPGRTAGMYAARDNTEAKAVFYFASEALDDLREPERQKATLRSVFADVGWEVPRLLAGLDAAPDLYFDSASQIEMPAWSAGRTVLLGDAGYCASLLGGNGTGLAVVGAYVLAGALAAAGGDHRAAFASYEATMRPYVAANQKQGREGGSFLVPASRTMIRLRNLSFRTLPYMPWKGVVARMARRTADAIDLPPDTVQPLEPIRRSQ